MGLIQQLVAIIEENLNSSLPVKILAERSGYSERWLYNLFHEKTGISVAQYIRRRKLTLSALLLRHTSIRITDISLMYNFSSPQTFSRSFSQQFKISPILYRRAGAWDMQFAQPVLYNATKRTELEMIDIREGYIPAPPQYKKRIHLGMDFINTTRNGRFVFNKNLFMSIMSIFEPTYMMSDFVMSGEMLPGNTSDTELNYAFSEINVHQPLEKLIPRGLYASQRFTGTYEQIIEFQMYDAMGALCKNKCVLKKGPMYTLAHRTENAKIMNVQYLIPCHSS